MQNQFKTLLNKYINGKANKQERTDLKKSVSAMPDNELNNLLSDVWTEYDGSKELNDFHIIQKKLNIPGKKYPFRLITSVAASLLICVMIGLQLYYYKDNKRLNNFISQEVMMNVESGERTNITLPDGTKVSLNSGTTISYAVDYGLVKREVKLAGEAFLDVVKSPDKPFLLHTEFVRVEVLGTQFNISAYTESDVVETTLLEGSVKLITNGNSTQTIIMEPNQKAIYNKITDKLSVTKKSSGQIETAWLEGKLVFRSANFKDIIQKLQQRYGIEIEVINMEKYNTDLFTGTFKEDYVNGVLKILQVHYNFTYTEEDGLIRILFQ